MALLSSNTTVYGMANVQGILYVGSVSPNTSVSKTTGSLIVNGGIGANGNIYSTAVYTDSLRYSANGLPWVMGSGGSGSSSNSFSVIKVSGQPDLIANTPTAPLTIVAGSGMSITTSGTSNTLTISSTGGFSGGTIANQLIIANTISSISNTTGSLVVSGGAGISGNIYSNAIYTNGLFYAANNQPIPIGGGGSGTSISLGQVVATSMGFNLP